MRRIPGAAFCALTLLAAAATAQTPLVQHVTAQLTANDLKADVSFLASDALEGRGTPSRGQEIAAEFVAAQFRRAGLEPAGDDGYFQTAAYSSVTANPDGLQLTLEIGGKKIEVDKAAMRIASAAPLDLAGAGALYRASVNDLKPEETRGKALILSGNVRMGPATLARLDPALVIALTPPMGNVRAGGSQLRDASTPVVPILMVWDQAIRDALGEPKAGPIDAKVTVHIPAPKVDSVKLRNVVGLLRGSDPALRDTYALLTAHYDHLGIRATGEGDHLFNGANDDASGTASVIEIAHALATAPTWPKRSIVFIALFGEELGMLGSRYYAQHPIFPLAKTVADINLEQMGRPDDNSGPRYGMVNATGFDFTDMTAALAKAGEEVGIKVEKDEQASDAFFARSDNQAFAAAGVPSTTLSVGYMFKEYHAAGDEWPKIDYENMAKVDRAVALGLYRIADSAEAPKWNAANPKTAPYVKAR